MKPNVELKKKQKMNPLNYNIIKQLAVILLAVVIFVSLYFGLPDTFSYTARTMTAIVCFGITLWAFEPIPLGLTALIILLLMLLFHTAETDVVFSGFASPAIYLIVGGMMLAKAVNETPLARRVAYQMLKKWGSSSKGLLGSILAIMQIQAFFIPATAVRTTLMLPIASMIVDTVKAKPGSNLRKMLLIGVAFGGIISGTAVMTAAVGNILTVEILNRYADIKITYFQWFFYTFPLWIILIPAIWILLLRMFPLPKEQRHFPMIKKEMTEKIEELGSVKGQEIRCMIILVIIVGLWLSEPLHGMHPSVPALIGVVLMALPGIGCASWGKVVDINYNTVLLLSVTLSMGYTLIDTGAADVISDYLSVGWVLTLMQNPFLAIIFIVLLTQVFHKLISNVSTAVVTIIPIVISIAVNANVDPMLLGFTAGLTSLYGYILVVETMPSLLVHSTGMVSQRDFLRPGFYATIITTIATLFVAFVWWEIIGIV